jgi:hypothetical protein
MVYDSEKEMEQVIGKLKDNSFIKQQQEELPQFERRLNEVSRLFGL